MLEESWNCQSKSDRDMFSSIPNATPSENEQDTFQARWHDVVSAKDEDERCLQVATAFFEKHEEHAEGRFSFARIKGRDGGG